MQPRPQISKIKLIKPGEEGSAVCYHSFTVGSKGTEKGLFTLNDFRHKTQEPKHRRQVSSTLSEVFPGGAHINQMLVAEGGDVREETPVRV